MSAQKTLQNKRDTEAKLTATGKMDKLPLVQDEIHDVSDVTINSNVLCVTIVMCCMLLLIVM